MAKTVEDLGRPMHQAFVSRLLELKQLAKRHEYALIFRKGGSMETADPVEQCAINDPQAFLDYAEQP